MWQKTAMVLCTVSVLAVAGGEAAAVPPPPPGAAKVLPEPAKPLPQEDIQRRLQQALAERHQGKEAEKKRIPRDSEEIAHLILRLDGTSVQDVIAMFAEFLGVDFVENPALKGEITLELNQEMKEKDVWVFFDGLLAKEGITYEEKDGKLVFVQVPVARKAE